MLNPRYHEFHEDGTIRVTFWHKQLRQMDRIEFKLNQLLREEFGATTCKKLDEQMEMDESRDLFQDDPFEKLVH